jgi:hypothetical protein
MSFCDEAELESCVGQFSSEAWECEGYFEGCLMNDYYNDCVVDIYCYSEGPCVDYVYNFMYCIEEAGCRNDYTWGYVEDSLEWGLEEACELPTDGWTDWTDYYWRDDDEEMPGHVVAAFALVVLIAICAGAAIYRYCFRRNQRRDVMRSQGPLGGTATYEQVMNNYPPGPAPVPFAQPVMNMPPQQVQQQHMVPQGYAYAVPVQMQGQQQGPVSQIPQQSQVPTGVPVATPVTTANPVDGPTE